MTKINKEGWEVKKWEEVLTIVNGKNQKAVECEDGPYPICGSGGLMGYASQYLCPEDTTIIGRKGNINKPIYMTEKFWNVDTAFGLVAKKEVLLPKLLFYFCQNFNFERLNKATTIPSLTKVDLLKISIPLPPLPIQLRIVEELDEINAVISEKKEQLRKLDELAQSIFYNMFGDPVTNEKGWAVKSFKQTFSLKSGDGLSAKNFVEGEFPVYGGNGIAGYHNTFNKEGQNIIIGRVGALCGNVHLVSGRVFVTDNAFVLKTEESFDSTALLHLLRILNLRQYARDALQPVISNSSLKDIQIILPPLPLQSAFASRVAAIEEEKAAIAESIEKMQTLLNARMQEYFG